VEPESKEDSSDLRLKVAESSAKSQKILALASRVPNLTIGLKVPLVSATWLQRAVDRFAGDLAQIVHNRNMSYRIANLLDEVLLVPQVIDTIATYEKHLTTLGAYHQKLAAGCTALEGYLLGGSGGLSQGYPEISEENPSFELAYSLGILAERVRKETQVELESISRLACVTHATAFLAQLGTSPAVLNREDYVHGFESVRPFIIHSIMRGCVPNVTLGTYSISEQGNPVLKDIGSYPSKVAFRNLLENLEDFKDTVSLEALSQGQYYTDNDFLLPEAQVTIAAHA